MAKITLDDIHLFYSTDREIFSRLVINLIRNPSQSLLVMALWMSLEHRNSTYIVKELIKLSNVTLNGLAEEAVSCLMCLESKTPLEFRDADIPLTAIIMGKKICSITFYENKFSFICCMKAFLNNVCSYIFTDILARIYPFCTFMNHPMIIPGFPHPTYGSITIIPRTLDYVFPSEGIWGWALNIEVPENDRTIFLTFSRGYPVTEVEVRELFTSHYGDCVEDIQMEPSTSSSSSSSDQSLYARLVVRDIETIDRVLRGGPIAKFKINGKHVWARKFERRESTF
ncbi:hypothetical protein ACH5RR_040124 [Cinchona calisaya]|uniref:Uncharacterized protein n=1 Tax=Cinchona calisaya TaxID=153742 RepID=A0ABD2XT81_9GENT